MAVLDADFVPPPDFLHRTVPVLLADSGLAFVQSRWGHANRAANWLTRVQGLLLDGHFAVEQEARFRAGLPLSFNGSAGVWNRTAAPDCLSRFSQGLYSELRQGLIAPSSRVRDGSGTTRLRS